MKTKADLKKHLTSQAPLLLRACLVNPTEVVSISETETGWAQLKIVSNPVVLHRIVSAFLLSNGGCSAVVFWPTHDKFPDPCVAALTKSQKGELGLLILPKDSTKWSEFGWDAGKTGRAIRELIVNMGIDADFWKRATAPKS
jgi:hypothetical protein